MSNSPNDLPKVAIDALAIFSAGHASPEERSDALTTLISAKVLPKQAESDQIRVGRELLLLQASEAVEPGYRLLGIAESVRLAQVVKRWSVELTAQLTPVFRTELPAPSLLSNADDRLNLARACNLIQVDWLPTYMARAIAEEDAGEKARAEWLAALFARVESLTDGFRLLAQAFSALRPATEVPGDTIGRRLSRTLVLLRDVILESEAPAGEDLGPAVHDLVSAPFAEAGRPQDEKVKVDLSREVLLTIHDLVRTRISVVADAEMYLSAAYCRKLCGESTWPKELRKPLDKLITDVSEAIVLLGRQGQCHQSLLDQLDVLCDHPERARYVSKELAAKHAELPEDVRDWLIKGRRRVLRAASEAAVESAASNADESIGLALQAARLLHKTSVGLQAPLSATLDIYEPMLAPVAGELFDRLRALTVQLEQAAKLRGISLLGDVGSEIEPSTKYFATVGVGHRPRMKVVQPAVIRLRPDGTPGDVVIKGLVD